MKYRYLTATVAVLVAAFDFHTADAQSACYVPDTVFDTRASWSGDFTAFHDALYFINLVNNGTEYRSDLWVSGGGAESTIQIHLPEDHEVVNILGATDDYLFFSAWCVDCEDTPGLWRIDKDDGTPLKLMEGSIPENFPLEQNPAFVDNLVFFLVNDRELWRSDGTILGTFMLRDFDDAYDALWNFGSYRPLGWLAPVENGIVFSAPDPESGVELWHSDGSIEGTALLKNFIEDESFPIQTSGRPDFIVSRGDVAYFYASTGMGSAGFGVHRTDGTENGTVELEAALNNFVHPFNDHLYFAGQGKLWSMAMNGDDAEIVYDYSPGSTFGREIWPLTRFGDRLIYMVSDIPDSVSGKVWISDGTHDGTSLLHENLGVSVNADIQLPVPFTQFGSRVIFAAVHPATGGEFWISDGTRNGTKNLADLRHGPESGLNYDTGPSGYDDRAIAGSHFYFIGNTGDGDGDRIWSINLDPGPPESAHSADTNRDYILELSELLRLIQFFNSGGFHVQAGTEDGYAPGAGNTDGAPHDSDYLNQDWEIELSELLRAIQLYNAPVCNYCAREGTEDGFAV